MLHTTHGIVLHSFKYSDTSLIVRILTRDLGLQSYLIPGARKPRTRMKASLFQPFTLVEIVAYHKENDRLQRLKEVRNAHPLANIHTDIRKSTIAMFLAEILLGVFRQQEPQSDAFRFISEAAVRLDDATEGLSVFHIHFLGRLTSYLGFSPAGNYSEKHCYFDLREGIFNTQPSLDALSNIESRHFYHFCHFGWNELPDEPITSTTKQTLLRKMITYYRYHLDGLKEVKSLEILADVFHGG